MDNCIARHGRLAEGTRRAVKAWGLELLCSDPRWYSNSLTVIKFPEGKDSGKLVRTAFAKYNLSIGLGLSEVAGKVFRIGAFSRAWAGRGARQRTSRLRGRSRVYRR